MGEELTPPLEIFVTNVSSETGGFDREEDQSLPAPIEAISDRDDLLGRRAVDEPFRRQRVGFVLSSGLGRFPGRFRRDVKNKGPLALPARFRAQRSLRSEKKGKPDPGIRRARPDRA